VTSEPTRAAPLKWVIVVDQSVAAGRMVNAVACVAASTGAAVEGLIARGGPDTSGHYHPGLPWAGCTVVSASAEELRCVRDKTIASDGVLVVDMPASAQTHRIYDDYLHELAATDPRELACYALSMVGPRNRIDKIVKKLSLLA
jgi:hypothetical protein